jgi:hypothetical protein
MLSVIVPSNAQIIHFEKDEGGFWIKQGKTKVLFFQREMNDSIPEYARNNYFHPVYDLNGNVITEDFPEDHLHHRGIFWAWHQILIKTNANSEFYNSFDEQITPQNTAMKCGAFVNIVNPELKRGVVIYNKPQNPEITGWILRQGNSSQNCAWPGREPVELLLEQPVTLRYSILIHNGKLKKQAIERIMGN